MVGGFGKESTTGVSGGGGGDCGGGSSGVIIVRCLGWLAAGRVKRKSLGGSVVE